MFYPIGLGYIYAKNRNSVIVRPIVWAARRCQKRAAVVTVSKQVNSCGDAVTKNNACATIVRHDSPIDIDVIHDSLRWNHRRRVYT